MGASYILCQNRNEVNIFQVRSCLGTPKQQLLHIFRNSLSDVRLKDWKVMFTTSLSCAIVCEQSGACSSRAWALLKGSTEAVGPTRRGYHWKIWSSSDVKAPCKAEPGLTPGWHPQPLILHILQKPSAKNRYGSTVAIGGNLQARPADHAVANGQKDSILGFKQLA